MLVLSRRVGERIMIGDKVVLIVTAIKGTQVKLSFAAPQDVRIFRGELLDAAATREEPSSDT